MSYYLVEMLDNVSPTPRLLLKRGQMVDNLSARSGNYIPIAVPVHGYGPAMARDYRAK